MRKFEKQYLRRGDVTEVALAVGMSYSTVINVLAGRCSNELVAKALEARIDMRKKEAKKIAEQLKTV